ncbi:MAG: bifunctional 4'-phosphopantothenoylcysteine decarboxylase/phosphopantothenoylcysteine synthetase, partial [Gammaproteobacteria bacterium]|nr:bifunctional 4'-phosphopantothenoylcysteine decarboxylase/phosphopantothenoylcysteine synthetase [Gammaproteobacteria bacterium]
MIAANQVAEGKGFETDENALEIFWHDGHLSMPLETKDKLARRLIRLVADRYHEKNNARRH